MIRRTSLTTYKAIIEGGLLSKKRAEVYDFIYKNGPVTGSQVQVHCRSMNSVSESVRNRITELVQAGVVAEIGETLCPVSKRTVILYDVTDKLPASFPKRKSNKKKVSELREVIRNLHSAIRTAIGMLRNNDEDSAENYLQETLLKDTEVSWKQN